MKRLISIFMAMMTLVCCEPEYNDGFQTFVIREGKHYSEGRRFQSLQSAVLSFEARFDNSAIYLFDDAGFQDSKNKLLGVADCNSYHHENSARFGWQWYHDQIEIFAYCYVNGQREEYFLGATMPGRVDKYELAVKNDSYIFKFNTTEYAIPRGTSCTIGFYQMLWPYFGGQLSAPHDVSIDIRVIR